MRWEARTAFVEIKAGTRLCIYQTPQIRGEPKPELIGDHDLLIQDGHENWINARAENANIDVADLVLPSGQRMLMTHRQPGEFESSISMGSMHSDDWIIR